MLLEDKWYYQNIPPDRHPKAGGGGAGNPETEFRGLSRVVRQRADEQSNGS